METIAVVAMGEMGVGIARRLVERGARVVTSLANRSSASVERARAAGVQSLSDRDVIEEASVFLSIVPPVAAADTALRFLPYIAEKKGRCTFIDCNAVAPQTVQAMAVAYTERGLPFGDASIIGLAPRADGYSPRIYMSGTVASEAALLERHGLEVRVLSERLGEASALKMAYAGITKGFQAVAAAMILGAARSNASEAFVAELKDTQAGHYGWLSKVLPGMYGKAYRWNDEMREIASFLQPEEGSVAMLEGAAQLYEHVARDNREGPDSEILAAINSFVALGR